jgi:hypothetical protein
MHRDLVPGPLPERPHDRAGRSVIAVVGIDRYAAWPPLANAVNDARAASRLFTGLGFEQVTAPLLDEAATGEAIRHLVTDDLAQLSSDDSLVLFFAGHGHTHTAHFGDTSVKTGCVIPVDGAPPRGHITGSWLRLDAWLSDVARLPPRHILVLIDACHSGVALGALHKWRDDGADPATELAALQARRSRRVITSALDDQRAMDGSCDRELHRRRRSAADLEVTRFEVEGGTLHAGGESTLTVQITNRGPGTAYRVAATVRPGMMNLHGRRLHFGRIAPNSSKLRQLRLTLPASETAPDAMLLVAFDEGNRFSPPSVSRRVPIAAPPIVPVLAIRCWFPQRSLERPELDAGEDVTVRCLVDNSGSGAANVVVEAAIDGASPILSAAKRVAPASNATFDLPLRIPRELAIDAAVQLAITARDHLFARSVQTTIVGVIRQPKLCAAGQLTHTQYRAKLAELRAALAAGDLTQAQFDRYDVELVTCLNDQP